MPDQSARYFIVHLQKTAGTALRDRFRSTIPESAIYPNATDGKDKRLSVISLSHLLERWQVRGPEIRLVAGHFPLSTVELLDGDFTTLSVLRPPVDRTLSYLRHQKKINPADRDSSLEEIYDDPFRFNGLIRNHMTRMFGITVSQMRAGDGALSDVDDDEELFERATVGISSLDALGLQPDFEAFWLAIAGRFGLDEKADEVSNTTAPEDAPERLVDRIVTDNALDIALYRYAERLVAERGILR